MSTPLASWTRRVLGSRITAPGGIGGQCVDLADDWIKAASGLPPVRANAVDWRHAGAFLRGWRWVDNTATNYPPAGALVVWGPSAAAGTDADGHIAVVLAADPDSLVTADQNWSMIEKAEVWGHSYAGVLGWWTRAL